MYKIYTLADPNTKDIRYVGVTSRTLNQRLSGHWWDGKNTRKTHLHKWINTLNNKPIIELLETCTDDTWEDSEKYWISQLKEWGFNLVNLHEGGKGVIHSNRNNISKEKPICQYSLLGKLLKEFNSNKEACKFMNFKSNSTIVNHLRKNDSYCGGYRWGFKDEDLIPMKIVTVVTNGKEFYYKDLHTASKTHNFCRNKCARYLKGAVSNINFKNVDDVRYDIV